MHKIAYIEDDVDTRELVALELERGGFVVDVFNGPGEFLIKGKTYDLILSDWKFGCVNLSYFLDSIDRSKLVILTGSSCVFDVECLAILSKIDHSSNIAETIKKLLSRL